MNHKRLTYSQLCSWMNARRLNDYVTFGELRELYRRIKGGSTYGQYSGYSQ